MRVRPYYFAFSGMVIHGLALDPFYEDINNILLLIGRKSAPLWDAVPLFEAAPTAGSRCMLGNKNRMPTHRCLLTVIIDDIRSQSLCYEVARVLA